jgi:hypothetical protein
LLSRRSSASENEEDVTHDETVVRSGEEGDVDGLKNDVIANVRSANDHFENGDQSGNVNVYANGSLKRRRKRDVKKCTTGVTIASVSVFCLVWFLVAVGSFVFMRIWRAMVV